MRDRFKLFLAFAAGAVVSAGLFAFGCLFARPAHAEDQYDPVTGWPYTYTAPMPVELSQTQFGGTADGNDTYKKVLDVAADRSGCTVANTSKHTMKVFLPIGVTPGSGPPAGATQLSGLPVPPGNPFYCDDDRTVVQGEVWISFPAAGDTYVVIPTKKAAR